MKTLKRLSITLVIFIMLFSLSGCWNYREIETLSIVSGMAIDSGENGYKYHLTFQYITSSSGGGKASTKPAILESDGNTIFDAVRNVIKMSLKKLYFSNCQVFVISSDLAKEGLTPLLDWHIRDQEPRITMELIISKEKKASDILQIKENSEEITAFSINKIIENSTKFLAKSPDVSLYLAYPMIYGEGISLILPAITMGASDTEKKPEISGTAIFKKDKLIGFLDDLDSRYLLYIKDKIKGGILLTNVNSKEDNVSLEITGNKTKVTPIISNGKVTMKLEIKTEVAFGEENSAVTNVSNMGLEEVQICAANTVYNGVSELIKKVQSEYNSDIFGFGSFVNKSYPEFWKKNSSQWDQIFPTIAYEISVEVKIKNTAVAIPRTSEKK